MINNKKGDEYKMNTIVVEVTLGENNKEKYKILDSDKFTCNCTTKSTPKKSYIFAHGDHRYYMIINLDSGNVDYAWDNTPKNKQACINYKYDEENVMLNNSFYSAKIICSQTHRMYNEGSLNEDSLRDLLDNVRTM